MVWKFSRYKLKKSLIWKFNVVIILLVSILPIALYAPRRIKNSDIFPTNDDQHYLDFAKLLFSREIDIQQYLFQTTNGHVTIGARLFYLIAGKFQLDYFFFLKQLMLTLSLIVFSYFLMRTLINFRLPQVQALLIVLIMQASNPIFQITTSVFLYVQLYFLLTVVVLSINEIYSNSNLSKLRVLVPIMVLVGITSVLAWITILFVWLSYKFLSNEIKGVNQRIRKRNFIVSSLYFFILNSLIHLLASLFTAKKSNLQDPIPLAEIVWNNLIALFTDKNVTSPYQGEYGNDFQVIIVNFSTNLLNWIIPNYISDDLQSPFDWAGTTTLLILILVTLYAIPSRIDLKLKSLLISLLTSSATVALFTYLTRGFSFAWYHIRYQPYLIVFSMLTFGLSLSLLSQQNLRKQHILDFVVALCLTSLLIISVFRLFDSPRYLYFWSSINA